VLQVKPLQGAYQAALNAQLTEAMNVFWAECYESSKTAVHRRNREMGESKLRFQVLPRSQSQYSASPRYGRDLVLKMYPYLHFFSSPHVFSEDAFLQKTFIPQNSNRNRIFCLIRSNIKKVKSPLCLIKYHAMKVFGGVEV
jgi:hypothetical protein